jgi:hypothetical protein
LQLLHYSRTAPVEAILVTGEDWAAQDLLVRFDPPVAISKDGPPMWTFCHSAHNCEYVDEAVATHGGQTGRGKACCEACDRYFDAIGAVAWYSDPFDHDNRKLYSACRECRSELGLESRRRPALYWK